MGTCGFNCAKYTLFFFNAIFWLIGAAILAIGIWLRVDPNILEYLKLGEFEKGDQELIIAAYLLIAAGGTIFIVGFCGCCGAIKESQCLLGFYCLFMLLIIGVEIAAGVYAYVKKDELIGKLEGALTKILWKSYNVTNPSGQIWNKAMIEFECCGVNGIADFQDSYWWNTSRPNTIHASIVPLACCVQARDSSYKHPQASNDEVCQAEAAQTGDDAPSTQVSRMGCADSVKVWLDGKAKILIGVGLGVAALEFIILVMACCVCCQLRSRKK